MELFTPGHLVVIAVVALVLFFGWKQLPDMSRSVGRSLRIFKTEIKGMGQDDKERAEHQADEAPKALDPAPAQVVRPVATANAPQKPAAARPRPTPRPTAGSSATRESRAAGQ